MRRGRHERRGACPATPHPTKARTYAMLTENLSFVSLRALLAPAALALSLAACDGIDDGID